MFFSIIFDVNSSSYVLGPQTIDFLLWLFCMLVKKWELIAASMQKLLNLIYFEIEFNFEIDN